MSRKAGLTIVVLFIIALAVVFAAGYASAKLAPLMRPASIIIATPAPSPEATAASPEVLHVYINGAVMVPGVYEFAPGALVDDALRAAGGFAPDADTRQLNLAQSLINEMHIYVPSATEAGGTEPPVIGVPAPTTDPQLLRAGESGATGLVNINTAGLGELQELPGIGPTLAQRIIDYRLENGPFASIAAIQDVSGIGQATFQELEPLITVDGVDAP